MAPPYVGTSTVLITGSAGFIGGRLAHRLLAEGHAVIGIDAYTSNYDVGEKLARTTQLSEQPGYCHVTGDLADLLLPPLLDGVDVVYHLAGRPGVRPSFVCPADYQRDNVEATARLVAACVAAPSVRRLVYASSSSIYGDAPLPFREDAKPAPVSPYGETKLEAERICLAANGPRLETVALRYFTVYGPGQRPDLALRRFAESALANRAIELLGDGTQSRDFTYVDDVVTATINAASAPAAGLAINVAGGSRVSLIHALSVLGELVGHRVEIDAKPFARGDVRHTEADTTRARHLLNFRPAVQFADGYRREVDWLRSETTARRVPSPPVLG